MNQFIINIFEILNNQLIRALKMLYRTSDKTAGKF